MDLLKRIWLFGYLSFLVTFFIGLFSQFKGLFIYKLSLASLLTSQCIVLYLGYLNQTRLVVSNLKKLIRDETFYHLSNCFSLLISKHKHYFLLFPFVIFSSYHIIFTLKDNIRNFPPHLSQLYELMKSLQPRMLVIATYLEILSVPYLLMQFLTSKSGIGSVISSVMFIRFQYSTNRRTQLAFQHIRQVSDFYVKKWEKSLPSQFIDGYNKCIKLIEKTAPASMHVPKQE